jgi:site-specific DNA-methyltransferase (adenine-specific)
MRKLVGICEKGGRIFDPFAGSGTTLVAADLEGCRWTRIEMTDHYAQTAHRRLGEPAPNV